MKYSLVESSIYVAALAAAALAVSGCATFVHGTSQDFSVESEPWGARVRFNGEIVGTTPFAGKVPRKEISTISVELDGYKTAVFRKKAKMSAWVAGNLVSWFIPGVLVDIADGAFYEYENPSVTAILEPLQDRSGAFAAPTSLGLALPSQEPQPQPQPQPLPQPLPELGIDHYVRQFEAGVLTKAQFKAKLDAIRKRGTVSAEQMHRVLSAHGIE